MKRWVLKLIEHKIRVSPIVIRDGEGKILSVRWMAEQRTTGLKNEGNDPAETAHELIRQIERNKPEDVSVA